MNPSVVDAFCAMVRIDSESGEEKEFLTYLADLFRADLGATCAFDAFGNLIARVPAKGCEGKPPVLFSCHGDTVKPGKGIQPVIVEGVIRSGGDTILGADDKAGIAELYHAVRTAARHPQLEIVVTREEELGLIGASHLDTSQLQAKTGFVLDSDAFDRIIIGGPSHMVLDIEVTGRAAHTVSCTPGPPRRRPRGPAAPRPRFPPLGYFLKLHRFSPGLPASFTGPNERGGGRENWDNAMPAPSSFSRMANGAPGQIVDLGAVLWERVKRYAWPFSPSSPGTFPPGPGGSGPSRLAGFIEHGHPPWEPLPPFSKPDL